MTVEDFPLCPKTGLRIGYKVVRNGKNAGIVKLGFPEISFIGEDPCSKHLGGPGAACVASALVLRGAGSSPFVHRGTPYLKPITYRPGRWVVPNEAAGELASLSGIYIWNNLSRANCMGIKLYTKSKFRIEHRS